jgi:hypothetical protein
LIKKGFKTSFFNPDFFDKSPDKEMHYYFWFCELQKWLRDEKKIHVSPFLEATTIESNFHIVEVYGNIKDPFSIDNLNSYEEALETGLFEALKLID